MALDCIFADSFDFYNSLTLYWDSPGNDTAIDTTPGHPRTGLGCLRINSAAFGPTKGFTAGNRLLCTTAFNPNGTLPAGTKANIMWLIDVNTNNQQIRVCYEPDGAVSVYNGNDPFPLLLGKSAAGVLDTGGYNYITCKAFISAAAGTVQVRVNGVLVLDLVAVRTQAPGSNAFVNAFQLLCLGTATCFHDDPTLWTWTDAADDITGAPVIYAFVPASDDSPLDWTPSTGLTHFNLVNSVPQSTATFVSSSTPGDVDQYIHDFPPGENNPPIPSSFQVLACLHVMLAELDAPGAHTIASDAAGDVGPAVALTTSYGYVITPRTPGPVATLADLATTPFGPNLVS